MKTADTFIAQNFLHYGLVYLLVAWVIGVKGVGMDDGPGAGISMNRGFHPLSEFVQLPGGVRVQHLHV